MVRSLDGRLAVVTAERAKAAARTRVLLAGELAVAGQGRPSLLERLAGRLRRAGDVVITTSSRPGRLWRAADMLVTAWSARTRVEVAVVEVDGAPGLRRAEVLTRMLTRAGVPVVHLLRGASLASVAAHDPGRLGRLLASGAASVALTGHLHEALAELGGVTTVIVDPVEVGAYPKRARRAAVPSLLWVDDDGSVAGSEMAVEVLHALVSAGAPLATDTAQLTLVGPMGNEAVDRAVEAARRHGLEDRLLVAGPLRGGTAQDLFAHHDVYVNAGDVDRAPIGVAEAMAAGMCVVSFDQGGAGYLVSHGVDGLLARPGDLDDMAATLLRLFREPGLAERLSTAAMHRAETFDWSHALPRWKDVLAHAGTVGG